MVSAAIREDMKKGNVEMERRIYISLPRDCDHTVHKLGTVSQNIISQATCRIHCIYMHTVFTVTNLKMLKLKFLPHVLILAWWYFATT